METHNIDCYVNVLTGISYEAASLSVLNDLVELFPDTTIMNRVSVHKCVCLGHRYTGLVSLRHRYTGTCLINNIPHDLSPCWSSHLPFSFKQTE